MGYNVKSSTDNSETSLEDSFTNVYWRALSNLQSCWMGDSGFDSSKFNQQLLFLIRLLPDKTKQKEILEQWANATQETISAADLSGLGLDRKEITAYAGMEVVTETVLFIVQAFELIHTDIVAPATAKEYQRAVLEVPDMDQKIIEAKLGDNE